MEYQTPDYKTLYPWASSDLLEETSEFTTHASIVTYRKSEHPKKNCLFGKEHDKFIKVVPCREDEPVCCDESSDLEGLCCFIYSTIFRKTPSTPPFPSFERALLTKIKIALAQLHPNSWAFVRAFSILCHHFGHLPSVDVFLYFFEAKNPGRKLWMSLNGVVVRVLMTLFQQSYKGFKGKFFKIQSNANDPSLLDGIPLYWTQKHKFKRPRCLEDLPSREREVCDFLSNLQAVFSTAKLIKNEYSPMGLKAYIGIPLPFTPASTILRVCVC